MRPVSIPLAVAVAAVIAMAFWGAQAGAATASSAVVGTNGVGRASAGGSAAGGAPEEPAGRVAARPVPFRGTIKSVDTKGGTFVIGTRRFEVTARSKLLKGEQKVELTEGLTGQWVTGSYQRTGEGRLPVISLYVGGKNASEPPAGVTAEAAGAAGTAGAKKKGAAGDKKAPAAPKKG